MKHALTNRDPGEETLFDPLSTVPKRCAACQATRPSLCFYEAQISHGHIGPNTTRPRTCLNAYNPATAEIPY